jgi:hypothetical protein
VTEVIAQKEVRIHKPRRCWGCARRFDVGARLARIVSVDGGKASSAYWCPVCNEAWWNAFGYRSDEDCAFGELRDNDPAEWEKVRARVEGVVRAQRGDK